MVWSNNLDHLKSITKHFPTYDQVAVKKENARRQAVRERAKTVPKVALKPVSNPRLKKPMTAPAKIIPLKKPMIAPYKTIPKLASKLGSKPKLKKPMKRTKRKLIPKPRIPFFAPSIVVTKSAKTPKTTKENFSAPKPTAPVYQPAEVHETAQQKRLREEDDLARRLTRRINESMLSRTRPTKMGTFLDDVGDFTVKDSTGRVLEEPHVPMLIEELEVSL